MFKALLPEDLAKNVPSIFTEGAADRTSDKYQHISTMRVLDGLKREGFVPVKAMQSRVRIADKANFTKHLIRLRHIDARPTVSGLFPEIVLINSHDGLSSYRLMSGIYRLICSNGLIAGNTYEQVKIRHQGDIVHNVIEGTHEVIKNSKKMIESGEEMEQVNLSIDEKKIFAETAHAIRFEGSETGENIKPISLLRPRRFVELNKNDLFTSFNIVQENIIKGGIAGYAKDKYGRMVKRIRTRAIKSIEQDTVLNRALWSLSEKMMELKKQGTTGAGDEAITTLSSKV
jgi:hypothetical protein